MNSTSLEKDFETELKIGLRSNTRDFDLGWARRYIKDFAKFEATIAHKMADERRYKERPGYIPNKQYDPDIMAAARRAFDTSRKIIAPDWGEESWDLLPPQDKQMWIEVAKAVLS